MIKKTGSSLISFHSYNHFVHILYLISVFLLPLANHMTENKLCSVVVRLVLSFYKVSNLKGWSHSVYDALAVRLRTSTVGHLENCKGSIHSCLFWQSFRATNLRKHHSEEPGEYIGLLALEKMPDLAVPSGL